MGIRIRSRLISAMCAPGSRFVIRAAGRTTTCHLSLVAGITRNQRKVLVALQVDTVACLAVLLLPELLRSGVFVDLYRAVKQGLRASVESYSIKRLEGLYGFARATPLREATLALQAFDTVLALGDARDAAADLLGKIESYNRDDCMSTLALRDWLEECRHEMEVQNGQVIPRPAVQAGGALHLGISCPQASRRTPG